MTTVVLHGSKRIVRVRLPHSVVANFHHISVARHPLVCQFRSQRFRTLHTGTDRQLEVDTDAAVVGCREELGTDVLGTEQTCHKECGTACHNRQTMAHSPVQPVLIPHVKTIQRTLNRRIERNEHLTLLFLQTQKLRTHHRGE